MDSSVIILLLVIALASLAWWLVHSIRGLNYYKGLTTHHLEDVLRLATDPLEYMLTQDVVGYLEFDDELIIRQCNSLAAEAFQDLKIGKSMLPDVAFPDDIRDRLTRIYQVRLIRHGELRLNHLTVDGDGKSLCAWSVKQSGANRYHAIFKSQPVSQLPIRSPLFDLLDEGMGFWEIDVTKGTITHNESWLAHLEYAGFKDAMPVSTWINLLLPDDRLAMQGMLDNPVKDSFAFTYRIASGRGVVLKMETRGYVKERGEDGRPLLLQGIHINRTSLLSNITSHDDDHVKTIATNLGYEVRSTNRNLDVEEQTLEDVLSTISDYLITEFGREVGKVIEFSDDIEMRCSSCLNDRRHVMTLTVYCPDVTVPRQMLTHLLTPGFSTSRIHPVNSISLARINRRVHDVGGHLALSTSAAKGLEISVCLPAAQARLSTKDVLIIDDEESVGLYIKKVLSNAGYSAHAIASSTQALDHFSQDPYQYRLVITDQTMPDMTGDVVILSMLEQRPDLPIVLCTGFSDTMTSTTAMEIGARAFLEKPIDAKQLLQVVAREISPPARIKEFV